MFHENLRTLRKEKGYSQEELANRLNVVRQTVSKWEKAQSVPDAEMLVKLADILEVPVSTLLGERIEPSADTNVLAQQLSRLNAQLAEKSIRSRRRWAIVKWVLITFALLTLLTLVLSAAA